MSEEAAGQLRLVLITLLGATERADPISTGPACVEDPASSLHQTASGTLPCQKGGADGAPPHNSDDDVAMESESPDMEEQTPAELLVEALCAARQLLGSFPGMQNDVLPLIGSIFSRQTGAINMLTFACHFSFRNVLQQASDAHRVRIQILHGMSYFAYIPTLFSARC